MSYEVKIDCFEGPIDLLLHLVEKNEMEIEEIKLSEVIKQYLDYIAAMQQMDLEIASEFLMMATKLMEMKVQLLLPSKDDDEDKKEDNPRQKLVEQLLEYKKYKDLASKLQELEQEQRKTYNRNVTPLLTELDFPDHNPLEEVKKEEFAKAFQKVLVDYKKRQVQAEEEEEEKGTLTHLRPEDITVQEQQNYILKKIQRKEKISFAGLFSQLQSQLRIIVTFMALLELIKQQQVYVEQEDNFSRITIVSAGSGSQYEQNGD